VAELFNRPLWLETAEPPGFPTLDAPLAVDVAVLGGGITGRTTAHFLKEAGRSVAVIEMNRIASATTGLSTAKLTVGHNLIYKDLLSKHGEKTARIYAQSNRAAIDRMEQIVSELQIECDWERASNYVYTEAENYVERSSRRRRQPSTSGSTRVSPRRQICPSRCSAQYG
jgi:glycine/D-amino acid oxidase-like deaminating enzyme